MTNLFSFNVVTLWFSQRRHQIIINLQKVFVALNLVGAVFLVIYWSRIEVFNQIIPFFFIFLVLAEFILYAVLIGTQLVQHKKVMI